MKQLLLLVLGLVLTTSLVAQAQATQVWQREYGERPFTYVDFIQPQFLRPNRLAAIVTTSQRISNTYYFERSGPIFFNSQGDTLSSRRYTFDIGAYYKMLPLPGGDLLLTGAEDSAYVPNTSNLSYFYVRTDSLGNRRTPLHYLPPYRAGGNPTPFLPMPGGGVLWAHTIVQTPYNPAQPLAGNVSVQVVRLDSAQRISWQRQYVGGPPINTDVLVTCAAQLLDGSYLIVGNKSRIFQPATGSAFYVTSGWAQRIRANGDTIALPEYIGNIYEKYEPKDVQPTPDGGYVVSGNIFPNKYAPVFDCCVFSRGWLAKFDSLGVMQWEKRIEPRPGSQYGVTADHVRPLADGSFLLTGRRTQAATPLLFQTYLARYPAGSGTTPTWETYLAGNTGTGQLDRAQSALAPDGSLVLAGQRQFYAVVGGVADSRAPAVLTRLAGAGTPYQPAYCQHPPQPSAGFALSPARDTLRLVDFSAPGPRFAQLERWRWHFPDGTFFEGRTPPPHRFAVAPGVGAAVTLTVTNNLGCSATTTIYPFGLPTAAQQARALAALAAVFPNPAIADGGATLTLAGLPPRTVATVQVLDALGRLAAPAQPVAVAADGTAALRLPLAGCPPGLYLVQVQAGDMRFVKKLVVQ